MGERTTKDTATPCIFANKKPVSSSFWVQLHVANPLSEVILSLIWFEVSPPETTPLLAPICFAAGAIPTVIGIL